MSDDGYGIDYKKLAEDLNEICYGNNEETIKRQNNRKKPETVNQAFEACQLIFGSNLLKANKEVEEIEKEYNGGDKYHEKLQELTKKYTRNKKLWFDNSVVDVCQNKSCKQFDNCNLRFLINNYCVWVILFENINNVDFVCDIIISISEYMKESEEQMGNEFTF